MSVASSDPRRKILIRNRQVIEIDLHQVSFKTSISSTKRLIKLITKINTVMHFTVGCVTTAEFISKLSTSREGGGLHLPGSHIVNGAITTRTYHPPVDTCHTPWIT